MSEPANAALTKAAVKLGLAAEWEDAGNRVWRLTSADVQERLADAGFNTVSAERYAMYYRHEPGRLFQIMSRGGIFPLVRVWWRAANALFGRFGNKMVVVAERTDAVAGASQPMAVNF